MISTLHLSRQDANEMSQHISRVRALYKALLKLHRGLPLELQALGTQYVKEEFRLHKNIKTPEAEIFLHEWTKYYVTLAGQLAKRQKKQDIGSNISPEMMDNLTEEQLGQLYELFQETTKTSSKETSQK